MDTSSMSQSDERMPAISRRGTSAGLVAGVTPLVLLIIGIATTILVSAVVLNMTQSVGFMTRQAIVMAILGIGFVSSAVIYTILCIRALRRARQWRILGMAQEATGTLWALALTALVVLLPVLIALVVPPPGW